MHAPEFPDPDGPTVYMQAQVDHVDPAVTLAVGLQPGQQPRVRAAWTGSPQLASR